jgi:D-inositol-3-phosphate glycosyltransferase
MALVSQKHPSWRGYLCLVVIGGEDSSDSAQVDAEMAYLRGIEAELGLEDLVTFAGAQDQDLLPYYYSAAQVVVVPSHYESFGMVALEAMACGTPVIASDVGGLPYTVQDGKTGYLVPQGDPEALAEKIALVLSNPALARQLGTNGRTFAQDYRWELIASQVDQLYQRTLSPHSVRGG